MKPLAIACAIILSFTFPAMAADADPGQVDHDVVQAAIQRAIDTRGTDEYEDALAGIYAIVEDPAARPACRNYADTGLTGLILIDLAEQYPGGGALNALFQVLMPYMTKYKNDCLLAI